MVGLVGLGDVQLAALWDLLEVCALVEGTAETSLPGSGVCLVPPLSILPLIHCPRLVGTHTHKHMHTHTKKDMNAKKETQSMLMADEHRGRVTHALICTWTSKSMH